MTPRDVAVVTGAGNGIGRAIAANLLSGGFRVIGVDIDRKALQQAETDLGDNFSAIYGDITEWSTHEAAAERAVSSGRLRVWVNNAGADIQMAAHNCRPEDIDTALRLLLTGPLYGCAIATRTMVQSGGGLIINIASTQGTSAFPRYFIYGPAKAALIQAVKNITIDYAVHGVRAVAVSPGVIHTPLAINALPSHVSPDEALRREGQLSPAMRVGQPEEIGALVAFLSSSAADYISGTEIRIDGGQTARSYPYPPLDLDDDNPVYQLPPMSQLHE